MKSSYPNTKKQPRLLRGAVLAYVIKISSFFIF